MTFSQRVKEELLVQDIEHATAKIELMAAFKAIGTMEFDFTGLVIEIKTSQIKLTKRLIEIIKHEYPESMIQTLVRSVRNFNQSKKVYVIRIIKHCKEILKDLSLIDSVDVNFILSLNDVSKILKKEDEKRVYTRMYFCCTGSVNDPKNSQQYHLEITGNNEVYLKEIQKLVKNYSIDLKITQRKKSFALYLNKSEEIADFLKFVKAVDVLFEFEDYRMIRDMMLITNRLNNADIANEVKKLNTSNKQINAIEILKEKDLFDVLGDKTKEIADLRLTYPDDSLQELAERTNGKCSKSNLRYHLNIILQKANLVS
jgi:DNA-binding protein WhiA